MPAILKNTEFLLHNGGKLIIDEKGVETPDRGSTYVQYLDEALSLRTLADEQILAKQDLAKYLFTRWTGLIPLDLTNVTIEYKNGHIVICGKKD